MVVLLHDDSNLGIAMSPVRINVESPLRPRVLFPIEDDDEDVIATVEGETIVYRRPYLSHIPNETIVYRPKSS